MVKAFTMMKCVSKTQTRYISSKSYESLRKEFSKIQSYSPSGIKNSQYNTIWINKNNIFKKIHKNELSFYIKERMEIR